MNFKQYAWAHFLLFLLLAVLSGIMGYDGSAILSGLGAGLGLFFIEEAHFDLIDRVT